MLRALDSYEDPILWKSLLVVLYYTGLRIAELTGDRVKRWKILSSRGRSLSLQGGLPRDWITSPAGDLWVYKYREKNLPGIVREDLRFQGELIYINAEVLKHGRRAVPVELPIELPHIELLLDRWEKVEPGAKLWPVTPRKAWEVVREISGGWIYPHAFRLSRASLMARTPGISVSDLQGWFGWARSSTADSYIVSQRSMKKARDSIVSSLEE